MDVIDSVLDMVGHTPMLRLARVGRGVRPTVLAKVETQNPGGSIKDRIGLAMIERAEQDGQLGAGGTIIEPTAGNTGLGLVIAATIKGYKSIFVMPDKVSGEKIELLKAYGAEVVITPTSVPRESPESYYSVADRLTREISGAFQPNQFFNRANPDAHYRTTGPEIWEQTDGRVDVLVSGLGTGGTIAGAGRYLKEQKPSVLLVGADPEGSIFSGDTSCKPYKVEGVGQSFIPGTADLDLIDRWVRVSDRDAFLMSRRITREEGLLVGGSCGLALHAALQVSQELDESKVVVVIFMDTGRNYLSKIYSDDWMRQNGFLERFGARRLSDVVRARMGEIPPLVALGPNEKVGTAIDMMQRYGISQLPVFEDPENPAIAGMVGSVEERALLDSLYRDPDKVKADVSVAMGRPFPTIPESAAIEEAFTSLLDGAAALIVTRSDHAVGLISRLDLLEFVAHR
ncbi:MAG: cystathionine beta-synthase [Chloroflexi bacterium]|jgi:cystathionine beta-synthase|nr:cystathionine beta-synthase [Chloroflexota bacterium]